MVTATTSDPLALDLWPPSGTRVAGSSPGDVTLPKLEMVEEYVRGLEEERSKMEGFRRELPLSMLIVTDVIEGLKGELARCGCGGAMVVKKKLEDHGEEVKQRKDSLGKVNWMSSPRLWNHDDHPNASGNAAACDTAPIGEVDGGKAAREAGTDEQPWQQSPKKARRCWSPELHRRFVSATEQLGGSQAATPKQIRRLMQVDGLTNDEVKSHLQKYRLHRQRLPVSSSLGAQTVVLWRGLQIITKENSRPVGTPRQAPLHLPSVTDKGGLSDRDRASRIWPTV